MLKLTKTSLKHLTPDVVNVSWEIESTAESFAPYEIRILQSETPTDNYPGSPLASGVSDYEIVASGINPLYRDSYDDDSVAGLTNKLDTLVYRVQVRHTGTGAVFTSPPTTVSVRGDNNARYIIRHREMVLNRLSGQKFLIYKKKTFGQYCTNCYDDTLQRTTIGKCSVCYGTGYVGGYYSPYVVGAQINESPPRHVLTTYGDWQDQDAILVMSVSPVLAPGDMVVDLYGRRWNVVTIRSVNKAMFLISQQAQMRQMEVDNIASDFPVPSLW